MKLYSFTAVIWF